MNDLLDKLSLFKQENKRLKGLQSNKNIENKKQLIEKLQNAEWQLLMVQSVGNVAFWEYNPDEKKYWGTDAAFHLWDMNPPTDGWIDLLTVKERIHPDDRNYVTESFKRFISNKSSLNLDFRIVPENKSLIKDNKHFNVKANAVLGDEKQVTKIIGTLQDITEMKKREKELIKAKEKAEESDRLKSAFLANMSHEIRTPMNGILGFADLLKEPNLSGEEKGKFISMIEKSGERMLNIINDLINISKIEAGQMEVEHSETNVNEILDYLATFFKPEVERKRLKLSVISPMPVSEAVLFTDREKLYAILTNLVKNAIKYTDKGSIAVGYYFRGRNIEFFVKDTGIGIPEDKEHEIFDRFTQINISTSSKYEGAGLGLSIAKAYVELLNGKIWLKSTEGAGSTFYFSIPAGKDCVLESTGEPGDATAFSAKIPKDLTVIIAEDDEAADLYLTKIFSDLKQRVIHANNGKDAVELCRKHPDTGLILMDIKMPEMDGYEATRKIREFNMDVIIIAQTAYALAGDREKAIAAGCNDYIAKPINRNVLFKIIEKNFAGSS